MASPKSIVEVSEADFEHEVLERSKSVPVLVDFWAPWCGPCRVLGPTLEKLAEEMSGAFVLAKVNSDENPALGVRFGVRGIPNVLLFRDGSLVDGFVGALPESAVREFLRPWVRTPADRLAAEGERQLGLGNEAVAEKLFREALAAEPESSTAHLGLARLAFKQGDAEALDEHTRLVRAGSDESEIALALRDALKLVGGAKIDRATAVSRLEANADDHEARYALAASELGELHYRKALEHYLTILEEDRDWDGQAPRKAMLVVFQLVGPRDPLSDEFRDRLVQIYY